MGVWLPPLGCSREAARSALPTPAASHLLFLGCLGTFWGTFQLQTSAVAGMDLGALHVMSLCQSQPCCVTAGDSGGHRGCWGAPRDAALGWLRGSWVPVPISLSPTQTPPKCHPRAMPQGHLSCSSGSGGAGAVWHCPPHIMPMSGGLMGGGVVPQEPQIAQQKEGAGVGGGGQAARLAPEAAAGTSW